ncbi:MAG: lytic murein transglycosylase [Thiobacillus sp.]
MRKLFLLLAALTVFPAHAQSGFDMWLAAFREEASAQGISTETLDAALTGITPIERVVELDQRQPEFQQTFYDYLSRRVTEYRVSRGRDLLQENSALLDAVEQKYGVPKAVLVSFWGLETNFGKNLGNLNIPASLVTLAYDGRRSTFFRSQLLDALRIIDAGHVQAIDMNGSWAGAMGHMQFMPSTFRGYAVDGDGDGRIDLWQSIPDAMYSGAHYLKRSGWRANEPVALEVRLPEGFNFRQASAGYRLPMEKWTALGVLTAAATPLPTEAGNAAILLPQGWQGPAFMVFDNFNVVMRWNRSVNYALSVAQLANQLAGGSALAVPGSESGALSTAQLKIMQQALSEMGYDAGPADGLLGPQTQSAIRIYQAVNQLPADGYPAPSLFAHVEKQHAAAAAAGKLTGTVEPAFSESDEQP